jgi:cyclopropane fatty-acyl-phospholipid synthase-like methyltransferase
MIADFIKYVGKNFGNPNGLGGKISTKIMNIINQRQYNAVLENLNVKPNEKILDIGFGNGYLIKKLFKKGIPVNVYGIEISKDMLHKVTAINEQYISNKTLQLFLENINKTSFEENLFDKIYTVNTIYFWGELEKSFSEIKRIMKPDGIFINVIYTKEYLDKIVYTRYGFNKYTVDEIKNITEKNGMKIVAMKEIEKNKSFCIISEHKNR